MQMLKAAWLSAMMGMVAAGLGGALPAGAMEFDLQMFGHHVAVESTDDGEVLKIDEQELHRNNYVHIERVAVIDGAEVVVGTSADGGNACASTPFVLTWPTGDEPKLEMFPQDCSGLTSIEEDGKLIFSSDPQPGRDGERWSWDPAAGFKSLGPVAFQSDPDKGWDSLAVEPPDHPSGLYDFGEIADQLDAILGTDAATFKEIITGVGSGEMREDGFYVGSSCLPHSCGVVEAIIVADSNTQDLYLAWKPENAKIIVRPEVRDWPPQAKAALRDWSATWN